MNDQVVISRAELTDLRRKETMLLNLLALIYHDGGQHTHKVGLEKAYSEALGYDFCRDD